MNYYRRTKKANIFEKSLQECILEVISGGGGLWSVEIMVTPLSRQH